MLSRSKWSGNEFDGDGGIVLEPIIEPKEGVGIRGSKLTIVLVIILLVAVILGVGLAPVFKNIEKSKAEFAILLVEGQYEEAEALYEETGPFIPEIFRQRILQPFTKELEAELGRLTQEYLDGRAEFGQIDTLLKIIDRLGVAPGNLARSKIIFDSEKASRKNNAQEAIAIIQDSLKDYPEDALLKAQLRKYQAQAATLVVYEGPIQHIFFHPLIAYPEMAFDGDRKSQGLNEFFVTVKEFDRIMNSLYDRGFILIDTHEIFEERIEGDKKVLTRKELRLPKDKKPLIISIDDINYYPYMIENGMNHKLILDEKGKIATYSVNPAGEEVISYYNEIITMVDKFVEEHPDFSYKGAKGILAVTGFDGVLGYRTNDVSAPNYASEKEQALAVIKQLKETGWFFASHGYGHLDTRQRSFEDVAKDTQKWKLEVEPLVGPTDLYIYPYGSTVPTTDPKFKLLQQNGFNVFSGVGPREYLRYNTDSIVMDRRHMDGIAFWKQPETLKDLFEIKDIIDPARPPL